MLFRLFLLACLAPFCLQAQTPRFQLTEVASNFTNPVDIAHCGDKRLFVVEQTGYIRIIDSTGKVLAKPFLDIDARVLSGGERGLLGLAFHPNYVQNGWFFVNYIKSDGNSRIARFSVNTNDPNLADPNTELPILEVQQPYPNHNGGCLKFGPDGQLYIGFGDGGSGGDPQNNGQKNTSLLGKFLRINVDSSSIMQPYKIPVDNPFVGNTAYRPEIWSTGWRNPWRFSFDRLTGDLWVGDVGQDVREEIDMEPAGKSGLNYGWRCYEAAQTYNTSGCQSSSQYAQPVFSYGHSAQGGCSVTGGFVYRGSKNPDLSGLYLFADYCTGRWWTVKRNADSTFTGTALANLTDYEYSSLGEDRDGELYVAGHVSGKIYRVSYSTSVATATPADVAACNVSPNPTQDVFDLKLELRNAGKVSAVLSDARGRILSNQNQHGQNIRMQFDLRAWPAGTYYLKVRTPGGRLVKEVIKL